MGMKKRLLCVCLTCAAVLGLLLAVCVQEGLLPGSFDMAQENAPSAERDFVDFGGTYDTGTRTLRGTQRMTLTNRMGEGLSEIVLRADMNGEDAQAVAVSDLKIDGQSVKCTVDEDDPTILHIDYAWKTEEKIELSFLVMIKAPKADGAALVTLPKLAAYEDGVWRTEAYDELAGRSDGPAFDYLVKYLHVYDGMSAAFGGELTNAGYDNSPVYAAQMQGARDVTFALLEGWELRRTVDGIKVAVLAEDFLTARRLLARTQEALRSLSAIGLEYPFPSLSVVQSDTGREDGESASGLIALTAQEDKETIRRKLTRLIARETFGVLVGNDSYNEPWLSHSLASAAELLAFKRLKGENAYETRFFEEIEVASRVTRPYGVNVGAGVLAFGGDWEMTQVLRDQGAGMLMGVGQAVGEETFLQALQLYVQQNAGQIASRADFEQALLETTGSDWSGYLTDELAF